MNDAISNQQLGTIESEYTTNNINLLIIEDDDGQIEQIQDAVRDFNRKEGEAENIKIDLRIVKTYNDAVLTLLKENFDAAIIDLKLSSTTDKDEGVDLIDIIIDKLRFPIFVRSGFPEKVESINAEHYFVKVFKKTDKLDDIVAEIVKFYKKGITSTIGTKGKVEKYLNKIFWERLSKNISFWDKDLLDNNRHEVSLVRYCLTLLQEHLEIAENGDGFLDYHPFEVFIKPPIKNNPFFGDVLFDSNNNYYIILSPSCDMAQEKYEKVTLVEIELLAEIKAFTERQQNFYKEKNKGKDKVEKAKKQVLAFLTNNHSAKYHFLPSYQEFSGGLINFQKVHSKTKEELAEMTRFASVSGKFSKDISARFSNYFARQGQPNLDIDVLLKSVLDLNQDK